MHPCQRRIIERNIQITPGITDNREFFIISVRENFSFLAKPFVSIKSIIINIGTRICSKIESPNQVFIVGTKPLTKMSSGTNTKLSIRNVIAIHITGTDFTAQLLVNFSSLSLSVIMDVNAKIAQPKQNTLDHTVKYIKNDNVDS